MKRKQISATTSTERQRRLYSGKSTGAFMTSALPSFDIRSEKYLRDVSSKSVHKAFDDCKTFLYYLDSGKGYEACKAYCVDGGASFECQCETLADIKTVQDYALWMEELCNSAFHGFTREVLSVSYCEESSTVTYVATLRGKHVQEGGPVPQSVNEMHTDYTYLVQLSDVDGKVESVRKIWNDFYALKQAGWLQEKEANDVGHRYD